jgi:hypothetical protein
MDRTAELTALLPTQGSGRKLAASPYVLQASQLLSKLLSFEHLLEVTADAFIDYHRWHPYKHVLCGDASNMTDNDRAEFSQQIAIFVTTFATEVRELRRSIGPKPPSTAAATGPCAGDHREEVVSYLLDRLGSFTKTSQRMQKEREKYALNPLMLLSGTADELFGGKGAPSSSRSVKGNSGTSKKTTNTSGHEPANDFASVLNKLDGTTTAAPSGKNSNKSSSSSASSTAPALAPLTQSFVDRYEAEIAPPTRLKEYKSIATKHKEILLKESKDLQVQYSEDLKEAHKMEHTVGHISRLLMEFVQILQTQRDSVDDVHVAGKQATDLVKDTDSELQLTIERSESHSRTMVILTVGLAILLLLLDFVTA